jgi:UDP-N-acetylmuramyl pentapeptide phosphotransferase/UDP-N-acetylglucosamine-1-phosphate transferase
MSKVELVRWILATVIFVPAFSLIATNWAIFGHNFRCRRNQTDSYSSWIPLVGGVLGVLAFSVAPVPDINRFSWIPLVVDYGCLIGLLEAAFYWSKYSKKRNEPPVRNKSQNE